MPSIKTKCLNCNKTVWRFPSQTSRKFCSRECGYKYQAKQIALREDGIASGTRVFFKRNCPHCGKSFLQTASHKDRPSYCSATCYHASRHRGYATCEQCGKNFEKRQTTPTTRNRFCSFECFSIWQRGENAPHWKGGVSYWRSPDWQKIRVQILKRDNYTCQNCGKRGGNELHVHHISRWLESHNNSPENLTTLCLKCHRKIEHNLPHKPKEK